MAKDQLADELVEPAIALVESWLHQANTLETRSDRVTMKRLGDLVSDQAGVDFVMQFVDRVARPDDDATAARQLLALVQSAPLPSFLSPLDKALLWVGARLAPRLPSLVMPLARSRMRSIVGHLVAPADLAALNRHVQDQRHDGYAINVNLLGEAVLGESEADRRLERLTQLIAAPGIDYVSVKLTAVASQLNHWAFDESLERVSDRLAHLVDAARRSTPSTFINFDMEEYSDLHLTVAAFKQVLGHPDRTAIDAGIVLQAYLPDMFEILQDLVRWANDRHAAGGGTIKIRVVKGANLAMEQVDAAMHGWPQAPFSSKIETDANYRLCFDWLLTPKNLSGVRIGVASHNLFDVAWVKLLADKRGVAHRLQFEMLQGMAPGQAKAVRSSTTKDSGSSMLLYTPAVSNEDFDVAIGYLFRRLEENAAPENFMRKLFELKPGTSAFAAEADFFRRGVALRCGLDLGSRRTQDRRKPLDMSYSPSPFVNEPDTDPVLGGNRSWMSEVLALQPAEVGTDVTVRVDDIDLLVDEGRAGGQDWALTTGSYRREVLHRAAQEIASRRGESIRTMMAEASKTFAEADVEVSEAVDFARWYGDRAVDLEEVMGADFSPFGIAAVVPPWNFPFAIPAGGILSALAAGNAVICKPAPETPRCAELLVEACWAAGVPKDVLQFVRTPDNEVGRHLIESVDAVILTGSTETADLFRTWRPELKLFAETSGKNALIVTPNADMDLAVQDLVQSAFGHSGQKCSAASIAILVGDVATSERFRRQLVDAVTSLTAGEPENLGTDVAPLVGGINDRLDRAIRLLDDGESWLVAPEVTAGGVLRPSVRDGVEPGSWFHRTECFGPVLGLIAATTLDEAIAIANTSDFGLTGGIHTLDPAEVEQWLNSIEVGNCYVNRAITGAIVQRQPFGGWKRSSIGPGAKAGGPNYVSQLGTWTTQEGTEQDDYKQQVQEVFSVATDETGLFCEANVLRYRPLKSIGLRCGRDADPVDVHRVSKAAGLAGVPVIESGVDDGNERWLHQLAAAGAIRVRVVGAELTDSELRLAHELGIHVAADAVTPAGRIEMQHYYREQALAITLHRFGNLVAAGQILDAI